ncbi:MAG: hypothetical protein WAS36_00315 [Candidatus Saccharimonadales bacterium]
MASYYKINSEMGSWVRAKEALEPAVPRYLLSGNPLDTEIEIIDSLSGNWEAFLEADAAQHHTSAAQNLLEMVLGVRRASRVDALLASGGLEPRASVAKSIAVLAGTMDRTCVDVVDPSIITQLYGFTVDPKRHFPNDESLVARQIGQRVVGTSLQYIHRVQHKPGFVFPSQG